MKVARIALFLVALLITSACVYARPPKIAHADQMSNAQCWIITRTTSGYPAGTSFSTQPTGFPSQSYVGVASSCSFAPPAPVGTATPTPTTAPTAAPTSAPTSAPSNAASGQITSVYACGTAAQPLLTGADVSNCVSAIVRLASGVFNGVLTGFVNPPTIFADAINDASNAISIPAAPTTTGFSVTSVSRSTGAVASTDTSLVGLLLIGMGSTALPTPTPTIAPTAAPSSSPTVAPSATPTPVVGTVGFPAYAYTNGLGINVHLSYGAYQDYPTLKRYISALGIKHIRDGLDILPNNSAYQTRFNDLASTGVKTDFITDNGMTTNTIATDLGLVNTAAVGEIEDPNELNTSDSSYVADDTAMASVIRSTITNTPSLAGVQLIGPSLGGAAYTGFSDLSSVIDYANFHDYTGGFYPENTGYGGLYCGGFSYGSLAANKCDAQHVSATKPLVSTEAGFCVQNLTLGCVSETAQATYLLRQTLNHLANGVPRFWIYDLVSEGLASDQYWGIVRSDESQRPAFGALAGLMSLLADSSHSNACTVPASVATSGVEVVALCKANGEYDLAMWQPVNVFDPNAMLPVPTSSINAAVSLSGFTPTTTALWSVDNSGTWSYTTSPTLSAIPVSERVSVLRMNAPAPTPLPALPTAPPTPTPSATPTAPPPTPTPAPTSTPTTTQYVQSTHVNQGNASINVMVPFASAVAYGDFELTAFGFSYYNSPKDVLQAYPGYARLDPITVNPTVTGPYNQAYNAIGYTTFDRYVTTQGGDPASQAWTASAGDTLPIIAYDIQGSDSSAPVAANTIAQGTYPIGASCPSVTAPRIGSTVLCIIALKQGAAGGAIAVPTSPTAGWTLDQASVPNDQAMYAYRLTAKTTTANQVIPTFAATFNTTTTYDPYVAETLVIQPPVQTATPAPTTAPTASPAPTSTPPGVVVNPAATGAPISNKILGVNNTNTWDETTSGIAASETTAGITETRLGGGANVDATNWSTLAFCSGAGVYINPSSTLQATFADIVTPTGQEPLMAVNWGSTAPACTGPGVASDAAAEVAYVKNTIGRTGLNWEIGNEAYGFGTGGSFFSTDYDLHSSPHDAPTYVAAVASFRTAMLAQDSTAKIGCGIFPGSVDKSGRAWDNYIMTNASCDFYDFHYYPETPGNENDATLLSSGAEGLVSQITSIQGEQLTNGKTAIPIYIGEVNAVDATPGKQSTSIVNGLFAAKIIGTLASQGIPKATWWDAYGDCRTDGNNSSSLYGYSNVGGFDMFSEGVPGPSYFSCSAPSPSGLVIPAGTLYPAARAFQLASSSGFVASGAVVVSSAINSGVANSANLFAYSSKNGTTTNVMLINTSPTVTITAPIYVTGKASGTFTSSSYGKTQYDAGASNSFPGLQTTTSTAWSGSVSASLPPYTMAVYSIN